jgi:hypothetical protein
MFQQMKTAIPRLLSLLTLIAIIARHRRRTPPESRRSAQPG